MSKLDAVIEHAVKLRKEAERDAEVLKKAGAGYGAAVGKVTAYGDIIQFCRKLKARRHG